MDWIYSKSVGFLKPQKKTGRHISLDNDEFAEQETDRAGAAISKATEGVHVSLSQ